MHIKSNSYYCEQCGLELYSKGKLCPDCANEVRNRKIFPKVKTVSKKPILEDSGVSGTSGKDSGRKR